MLKKFIHFIAYRRHPWRHMQFDELAEIYTSMMMRSLGFSLMGIFVPVYLYTNGVSVQNIFLFFTFFFALRIPVSYWAAYVIGKIGPKHSIAVSTVLLVGFLCLLLSYNLFEWPLLVLAIFFTLSNGLFFIAYDTDFSKIKHSDHGGKELGYLLIFERFGSVLGPLIGGIVASIFIPELTIVLAILVLIGSIIPLLLTNEPVRLHQHISFKNFAWRKHIFDYTAMTAFGLEHAISAMIWPLFVAVVIFDDDIYAKLGAVVAIGMVISILSASMFGRVIDSKHGSRLLKYGAPANALLHLLRPFISNGTGVVLMSATSEPVALSIRMPLTKGFYDTADSEKGYRIVYFTVAQMITSSVKALVFLMLFILGWYLDDTALFTVGFLIASLASVATLSQRFPALKKV